ncbi:TIGR01212 family radical SAM protein [Saccharicrinis fermentans]|uniref:Coproporphyrinogen III oxidase n=1 Tax=Saccharicrinis fermentans DSM 9555 = JCM 21142 TaxID=869213 RepID=W7XWI3_9BACT|nr:TIGR01212 family radical SAM protein [Saccharicrinis fermentans]GAF02685.1 coproporphyrinogen III oxidase [Saccharicrinis fermentans DSM 9555 = JCM 21142]
MEYLWGHARRFNDYSSYIKKTFNGRVQKVSVDAGFSCPNRDGSKGTGGCTFCNNSTFNPAYCGEGNSITQQIDTGIAVFAHKYKTQRYLAYFQAYSNTYAHLDVLKERYREALEHPQVIGIVIGTRPDCISDELLDYLAELNKNYHVTVEYGIESTLNTTLLKINRGHNYESGQEAIMKTAHAGINVGAHLILGLPGESRDDVLRHAREMSALPLDYLKLHQLQLVRGSAMGEAYLKNQNDVHLYAVDEYIELVVDFLEILNPGIVMERFISQSPKELLIAPQWGLKNFEFVAKVEKRLKERDTWQGKLFVAQRTIP